MSTTRLKFSKGALRDIRRAPGIAAFTREVAEKVAAAAGPGFVAKRSIGRNRSRYTVVPTTPDAYRANYEELAVVRALGQV